MAAAPPRMLLLNGGGHEAFVVLPTTYDKAIQAAADKFTIPKNDVRLSCAASDMPWIGAYVSSSQVYITDNDSYYYACAQKAVVRLNVVNVGALAAAAKAAAELKPDTGGAAAAGATGGGAGTKAADGGAAKAAGGDVKAGAAGSGGPAKTEKTADASVTCETSAGKTVTLSGTVSGELAKGPPAGNYLGTLTVEDRTAKQKFVGRALGPNEILTKYVIHDQATARLLFRPRSVQSSLDVLSRTDTGIEVSYFLTDWQVLAAYPMTTLVTEGGQTRVRWFAQVQSGGSVTDLLTGTESSGLFVDLLPSVKAAPAIIDPEGPLIPAWPDIRPQNAFCLPQSLFIPHIERILAAIGVPAYRLLSPAQLEPSIALRIIPPPQVLVRVFVLFRGVADADLAEWQDRGLLHAEAGLDWKDAIGWDADVSNEEMFRVIEYAFMNMDPQFGRDDSLRIRTVDCGADQQGTSGESCWWVRAISGVLAPAYEALREELKSESPGDGWAEQQSCSSKGCVGSADGHTGDTPGETATVARWVIYQDVNGQSGEQSSEMDVKVYFDTEAFF